MSFAEEHPDRLNGTDEAPETLPAAENEVPVEGLDDEPDDMPWDADDAGTSSLAEGQRWLEAEVKGVEERLESVEDALADQDKNLRTVRNQFRSQGASMKDLHARLRDERILEIARGLETFLHRVEDTHNSMRATLDSRSTWLDQAWRLVAIITLVAWGFVGIALGTEEIRVAVGRSLITEQERLMIEWVEDVWEHGESESQSVDGGAADGGL